MRPSTWQLRGSPRTRGFNRKELFEEKKNDKEKNVKSEFFWSIFLKMAQKYIFPVNIISTVNVSFLKILRMIRKCEKWEW